LKNARCRELIAAFAAIITVALELNPRKILLLSQVVLGVANPLVLV